ncbi:MAG: hypothetical protein NTW91_10350 [Verrucomicrobia bacterium]|nr:hypothetical protein [Verrucomicrobiota bacterium]
MERTTPAISLRVFSGNGPFSSAADLQISAALSFNPSGAGNMGSMSLAESTKIADLFADIVIYHKLIPIVLYVKIKPFL